MLPNVLAAERSDGIRVVVDGGGELGAFKGGGGAATLFLANGRSMSDGMASLRALPIEAEMRDGAAAAESLLIGCE